jgi:serine protease Do
MPTRTLSPLSFAALIAVPVALLTPKFFGTLSYALEAGQATVAKEELATTVKDISRAFQTVAKALRPSVVNVSTVRRVKVGDDGSPFGGHPELRRFREFFGHRQGEPRSPERFHESRGLGTGVIVSEDGFILTNNHVVSGAEEVRVTLTDGRVLAATIVGRDEKTDLAVLKVEGSGLLPATLGDSEGVEVGEWVLAIGNPFGFRETVTSGIVSAKHRDNLGITDYENFIQTDAAINPGNSGGPLVNLDGEVIGINTAIASRTGSFAGVSFAIPINMGRSVMEQLISDGKVVRGWLGVGIQDLTEDLSQSFGYRSSEGVLVAETMPDGPGATAGLQGGDILVRFDGKDLRSSNHLRNVVARTSPGTEVELTVVRDSDTKTLRVTLGERTGDGSTGSAPNLVSSAEGLGLTVRNLTAEAAEKLNLDADDGVLVTGIKVGGLAANAGLQAGDIITRVGNNPTPNAKDLSRLIDEQDLKQGVRLQIVRDGFRRFVFVKARPNTN